jgi:hypothetical protein
MENYPGGTGSMKAYIYAPNGVDYASDKWDFGFLKEAFDKKNVQIEKVLSIPNEERAFVVVPGPQSLGYELTIRKELSNLGSVVLFITGDEQGLFDFKKIKHPQIKIWVQYPYRKHEGLNFLPTGVPQHLNKNLPRYPKKSYSIYFGGQVTHPRRKELGNIIKTIAGALYRPTPGFAKGDKPHKYYQKLASAKIAAAPAGSVIIDSFRFYEAIEMLCLPIADTKDSSGRLIEDYWTFLLGDVPVITTSNWNELPLLMEDAMNNYPANMHKIVSWWMMYKRNFANKIMEQINEY